MQSNPAQHEVCGCVAELGAIQHQAQVLGFHMSAALFQAMGGCHLPPHRLATTASFDARFHHWGLVGHGGFPR
jgi:hypothetical protein